MLALPAAGRHGVLARQGARFVLNLLRSVPELVWSDPDGAGRRPGPFAGTLALALHTTRVLGRLFAEALENSSPARRTQPVPVRRPTATCLLRHPCRWWRPSGWPPPCTAGEMNIRMAAILGLRRRRRAPGAQLYFSLSLFQEAQASTVIIAMLAMAVVVDGASAWLRRRAGAWPGPAGRGSAVT